MFGKMVYYDAKAISEYSSFAAGKKQAVMEAYSNERGLDAQVGAPPLYVGIKNNTVLNYRATNSLLLECNQFEKLLDGRDDFLDFTISDRYDITTAERSTIIKFNGFPEIPEQFDLIQVLDRFRPFLNASIDATNLEAHNKEVVRALFNGNNSFTVPVVFDLDNHILCGKAHNNNLLVPYEEMEEMADESVTVLARLSSMMIPAEKNYYDPLKDFMHLNRAMRKKAPQRIEGMEKLYVDGEYRNIEILAIYL